MKKIWLDLELSGDIDDAVTLLFALETNLNIHAVSLLNPNEGELSFVRYWLNYFDENIDLFVHYDKSVKTRNGTNDLVLKYTNNTYPILDLNSIVETDYTVLGGGAYTIPNILREKGFEDFVLQGGYAGSGICPTPVVEKFKDKITCASWNPNIDKKSTNEIINSFVNIAFISKDICHDSGIDINFVKDMNLKITKDFLLNYFNGSDRMKSMHDLVALLYIVDNSFCTMVNVDLKCKSRHEWYSVENEKSNQKISINWDKEKFLSLFSNKGEC